MTPHRFRQLAARGALVACLAVGAIACGDDDDTDTGADDPAGDTDDDTGDGEQAAGDGCAALVEFNAGVNEVDPESMSEEDMASTGEELSSVWERVVTAVPEDAAADAEELQGALDDLAAGDPAAFGSDETFERYSGVVSATVPECGFETVAVTGVDYAFEGLPETISAGTVALEFENATEAGEMHEIALFKKAEGETRSAEEIMNDPAAEEEGPGEFAGVSFAPPGVTSIGLTELTPGEYIAVCFIPTGSGEIDEEQAEEGAGGPPHFTQGMLAEFTVE